MIRRVLRFTMTQEAAGHRRRQGTEGRRNEKGPRVNSKRDTPSKEARGTRSMNVRKNCVTPAKAATQVMHFNSVGHIRPGIAWGGTMIYQ